jgi:hypothetical protein
VKERSGIVYFRLGILRLKGLLRAVERGRLPVYREEESDINLLLESAQTQRCREKLLNGKW